MRGGQSTLSMSRPVVRGRLVVDETGLVRLHLRAVHARLPSSSMRWCTHVSKSTQTCALLEAEDILARLRRLADDVARVVAEDASMRARLDDLGALHARAHRIACEDDVVMRV